MLFEQIKLSDCDESYLIVKDLHSGAEQTIFVGDLGHDCIYTRAA